MTLHPALCRLASSLTFQVSAGLLLLTISGVLLSAHMQAIGHLKSETLPLLASLAPLEHRLMVLSEQMEVSALDASLRSGSQEERVRTYVLPRSSALDRVLAVFDLLQQDLKRRGLIASMSSIDVGKSEAFRDDLTAVPVTVRFDVRGEGMATVLSLTKLAGALTVGDALSRAERAALLRATEDENPAGIVALEQFLATDLALYAHDARATEEQVRRSFSGEAFLTTFRTVLDTSLLNDARTLFGGDLGRDMERARLWPMQFMLLKRAEVTPGRATDWYSVDITVLLLGRGM